MLYSLCNYFCMCILLVSLLFPTRTQLNPLEDIAKVINYDKKDKVDKLVVVINQSIHMYPSHNLYRMEAQVPVIPFLEVDPTLGVSVDLANMTLKGEIRQNDIDFEDDDSIPPLE